MLKRSFVVCAVLVAVVGTPQPAAADWLLSLFVGPIMNVKTSESDPLPAENFGSSVGYGVNLASAFPTRGNLGFELDWGLYPNALHTSDVLGTTFASRLMTVSTNFFYSPATPRARPYFSVGPHFAYRSDHSDATVESPSGWGVGINAGGGVMVFANERFGARVDLRYYRNIGDVYDLRPDAGSRSSGWKDIQFFRLFFGGTIVLN